MTTAQCRCVLMTITAFLAASLANVGAVTAQEMGTVVLDGLNSPMGVLVAPDGTVWVADTGLGGDAEMKLVMFGDAEAESEADEDGLTSWRFGETARVVQLSRDGTETVVAMLPSMVLPGEPFFNSGGAHLAMVDGLLYVTLGMWWPAGEAERPDGFAAVVRIEDGHGIEVANTWDVEQEQNPDGWELGSNPYGLGVGPDGKLWVADAAANSLLRIDPETGQVEVAAVFDGIPGPIPNPDRDGALETAPVPTGVAFDQSGTLYVSLLPGVPFVPGSAKVVEVSPDGTVADYATGLTMLTDVQFGPDGHLYAVSMAEFTEQGPTPESGAVIRIAMDGTQEAVVTGLVFPTSIDFNAAGDAYVTVNGLGEPGTGQVVMYSELAAGPNPAQ